MSICENKIKARQITASSLSLEKYIEVVQIEKFSWDVAFSQSCN